MIPEFKQFKDMTSDEFKKFLEFAKESQTYQKDNVFNGLIKKLHEVQKVEIVDEENVMSGFIENIGAELYEIRKMLEIIADIMTKDYNRR
jgi:hypothetical protein